MWGSSRPRCGSQNGRRKTRNKSGTHGTGYSQSTRYLCLSLAVFFLTAASPSANFSSGRSKKSEPPPIVEPAAAEPKPVEPPVAEPIPAEPEPSPVPGTGTVPGTGVQVSELVAQEPTPPLETVWLSEEEPHSHPSAKGLQSHGYSPAEPLPITANGMITQEVWLDPADPPKGIALQLKLATGDEVGVYWEGEEELFKPEEGQELWYYGPLPELGQWTKLEILAEDMGLEEAQVTGVRFVTWGGRVLWNRTVLTQAPPLEEAQDLLDQPIELRPSHSAPSE